MSRSTSEPGIEARLIEHLKPNEDRGRLLGFAATTYETDAEFIDRDLLPTLLGVGSWKDEGLAGRVQVERRLQELEGAEILFDPEGFRGRPRSLRLDVRPRATSEILHAKVTLLVNDGSVTVLVGSANLSAAGWRRNRECAAVLSASKDQTADIRLIREALAGLRPLLRGAGIGVVDAAALQLDTWQDNKPQTSRDAWFVWSGPDRRLWEVILEAWPEGATAERITACSPFWTDSDNAGPLGHMAALLSRRDALAQTASVSLIAQGWRPLKADDSPLLPRLPRQIMASDLRRLGFSSADAVAASPNNLSGEPGHREFHAKVLLLEGPTVTLAYLGSANFTARAYGLVPQPNQEAGLLLLRKGAAGRSQLRALLPPIDPASRIQLNGSSSHLPSNDADEEVAAPWPHFLTGVELDPRPRTGSAGTLSLVVAADQQSGPWSCSISAVGGVDVLYEAPASGPEQVCVPLDEVQVRRLLAQQQLLVRWGAGLEACVPLNVVDAGKVHLPIAPDRSPSEADIIAYLMGQLTWSGLFGASEVGDDDIPSSIDLDRVDTSGIVAYRMRDFVEALPGMPDALANGVHSLGAMRLVLMGPASPLALARHAVAAAKGCVQPQRTVTTAAYQVIELMAAVEKARTTRNMPETLAPSWQTVVGEALTALAEELEQLRSLEPVAFAEGKALARIERMLQPLSSRAHTTDAA